MHAAMVLDDGVLAQQTAERFDRVMAPKINGAWNLHLQSKGLPLDFFVLFSSIATIAGSPGQGGYVAANSFLESFAHYRRAKGLPALAINWGVISEVGFVARNAKVSELLAGNGLHGISPAEALAVLGQLLRREEAQFAVGRVDWRKLADAFPVVGTSSRYAEVVETQAVAGPAADGVSFRDEIGSLPVAEQLAAVTMRLKEQIAKVLRTSEAKLDPTRPLSELGLDSLMGVELLNRIETSLGISLPAGHLAAGTSISTMAAQILETVTGEIADVSVDPGKITKAPPPASSLVPLRPDGSLPPLFCLHSAGGLVNVYENLVKHIASDFPVYGLQSRAVLEDGSERGSLPEMANDYAILIEAHQPLGPIRLLGFSFGGFIAMAVANLLERAGRVVDFIGLIDADLRWTKPDYLQKQSLTDHISELYRTFARELKLLQPLDDDSLRSFAGSVSAEINDASSASRVENVLQAVTRHGYISPGLPQSLLRHYLTLFFAHLDFLSGHAVSIVRAPLTIWSGRETKNESAAWRQFTSGSVTENFVDGAHYDLMYSPLVERLAAELTLAVEKGPAAAANVARGSAPQRPDFSGNGHGVGRSAARTRRGDDVPLHVE
jgi:thioesterase domain-containing protein/acyl carrier protein